MRDERGVLALCDRIREVAVALHNYLRHGHLEKVYENGLAHRLCKALATEHVAQVLNYLRASNQRDALLINFGAPKIEIRKLVL